MAQAAQAVGLNRKTFYWRVYTKKDIPRPRVRIGRSYFYDTLALAEVIATVQRLRSQGEI